MQITLAQGIQLISQINNEIHNKLRDRSRASTIQFAKGDTYIFTDEVDVLTHEIEKLRSRVTELKVKIGEKNVTTKINYKYNSRELSIAEALIVVQQIRGEINECQKFAGLKTIPEIHSSFGKDMTYIVANLDPEKYKSYLDSLSKKANRLSTEIDVANYSTKIDVEWADEYIG